MKTLNLIAWISASIGLVLVILGLISGTFGRLIFKSVESIYYIHTANSFFLITIVLFLFLHLDQHKKV
jgi:hypothetical protein